MKLRGALLGAGHIAMRGHAPQWLGDPGLRDEVEIVAVSDLAPVNLELARESFPAARVYASAQDLLDHEDLDFCDICTPPSTHRLMIESGAARKLHLLCEKPLANTLEEAESIAHTVRTAGVVFQPCHQYHYSPQWAIVRSLLPRLGPIYLAEYDVLRTGANEGNPHWRPKWRTDPHLAGGGILIDHGAHIFYQLFSVLGKPASVQATVRTLRHWDYGVEDTACVILDFGTALATIRLTWAARRREVRFRFVGERGEIVADDGRVVFVTERGTEVVDAVASMSNDSAHSDWYTPLFTRFAQRVRTNETGTESLEEALMVTRIIAQAYASSAEGRVLAT